MSSNPVDLLFSDYRRAVLALLLPRPDDALHVREIGKRSIIHIISRV